MASREYDVVAALGWLHWEPLYDRALDELWRVTRRHLFFDLRLIPGGGPPMTGRQRLALSGSWDGHTTVPYICVAWEEVARRLAQLRPLRILGHGYWGRPADTVVGVDTEICFATFVLERSADQAAAAPAEVSLELPFQWPSEDAP